MSSRGYTEASKALVDNNDNSPNAIILKRRSFLEARLPQIGKWVRDGVKPEALVRYLLLDLQNQPALASCTPESLYVALLACAQTGLEPGALRGECYLIPYGKQATFVTGYRGLIKQARRSGNVTKLTANVVHAADEFILDLGTGAELVHRPARSDRGDVIGAYAIAKTRDGEHDIEWMDRTDLDKRKAMALRKGASPAWKDWESEMMRKSPIRRLCKRLPLGSDYFIGLALDEASDTHGAQHEVLDILADGEATKASAGPREPSHDIHDVNAEPPAEDMK